MYFFSSFSSSSCSAILSRKVNLLEDGDGNIHLRNLSLHQATNEEEGEEEESSCDCHVTTFCCHKLLIYMYMYVLFLVAV